MKPIKTDMQPPPESRLKLFAANVNQPQNMYVVKNYVYVGNSLKYMITCGECRVVSCGNFVDITEEDHDCLHLWVLVLK